MSFETLSTVVVVLAASATGLNHSLEVGSKWERQSIWLVIYLLTTGFLCNTVVGYACIEALYSTPPNIDVSLYSGALVTCGLVWLGSKLEVSDDD